MWSRFASGSAPEELYDRPPEYGGLLAVYPILDSSAMQGCGREMLVDMLGPQLLSSIGQAADEYYGEVWSIQLTARPGYYVSPQVMVQAGFDSGSEPPYG